MEKFSQDARLQMFSNRLSKVYRHLAKAARRQHVTCYRIYDHDMPEFPFIIELYSNKLYVAEYKRNHPLTEEAHQHWLSAAVAAIADTLQIPAENIFLKTRQRKTGRHGQYQKTNTTQNEFTVTENGLQFIINLDDYLDTGLFLDHRITRQMAMQEAAGKKVLNLFAYTGSFSVYAAAGGAAQVTTVDLSKTYTGWAQRNMQLNGFTDPQKYFYIQADVLQYLKGAPAAAFDLIILDPPTFSNSKRMEDFFDIQQQHVPLINDCLRLLKPGGKIYFSTNARTFALNEKQIAAAAIKDITKATTPFDFEGRLFRWCYLITSH